MFFRSHKKTTSKPRTYSQKGRFGPVYIDEKTKTISFQEKKWRFRFEVSRSQALDWFGRNIYRTGIAGVLIVSVLGVSLSMPSEAKVAEFYAGTCLGGWQNPSLAQGEPDVVEGSLEWFDSSNSTINTGAQTDIFCGNFLGDVPKNTEVSSAELSFSLYVGDVEVDEFGNTQALGAPEVPVTPPQDVSADIPQQDSVENTGESAGGEETNADTASSTDDEPPTAIDSETSSSSISIEGDDFFSQVGAILDAEGDVSFTLTEGGSAEEVVVNASDDFATSAIDILDAPEGSTVSVTDAPDPQDQTTINGNLIDNFFDILDSPDGASVQMSFPDDEPAETPVEEPVAEEPVAEEPADETSAEETAALRNIFQSIFGGVHVAHASTTDDSVATSSDETSSEQTSIATEPGVPEDAPADIETEPTATSSSDSENSVENIEENTETPDITDTASTSDDVASSSDQTTASTSPDEIVVEDAVSNLPEYSLGHVLTVEYTFDGVEWLPVGEVTTSNWQDVSFNLPIVEWDEVENVQVRLTRDNTEVVDATVMLDAVALSVSYDKTKKKGVLINNGKSFKANDNLVFSFKYKQAKKNPVAEIAGQAASVVGIQPSYDKDFIVPRATLISVTGMRTDIESSVILGPDDEWQVVVVPNTRSMRPGKYIIEVEVEDNGETTIEQQEFYWGVLTINTNKSVYEANEQAYLQMGVLDDQGHTICDANLQLIIEDPDGNTDTFLTDDGSIQYSELCAGDTYVEVPDYAAYHTTSGVGSYTMTLQNLDNGYEVVDSFEVRGYVPFVVERIGPTRIYPPATYEMEIRITAEQDFAGDIYEYMPADFEVLDVSHEVYRNGRPYTPGVQGPQTPGTLTATAVQNAPAAVSTSSNARNEVITFEEVSLPPTPTTELAVTFVGEQLATEPDTKELYWDASMSIGDQIVFTYTFDAPDISPELFLLGPLEFYE